MSIYKPNSVHPMNRYLDEMTNRAVTIHDIDCVFRNHAKEFWCLFEWKNPAERMGSKGTLQSLHDIDQAFNRDADYCGLFIVRLGFSIDTFPLDDDQQCEIQHICGGVVEGHETYTRGARSAIQHILDHGRLL